MPRLFFSGWFRKFAGALLFRFPDEIYGDEHQGQANPVFSLGRLLALDQPPYHNGGGGAGDERGEAIHKAGESGRPSPEHE